MFFFFFQAEDGIRDLTVTGVQTCALPISYFGICLGMQTACIEFARNACDLKDADSTEFNVETPYPIIFKLRDLVNVEEMGGTMRLGAWVCRLSDGSLARDVYDDSSEISERHRHRYEFNPAWRQTLEQGGLV